MPIMGRYYKMAANKSKAKNSNFRRGLDIFLFLLPGILLFVGILIAPIAVSVFRSFQKWNGFQFNIKENKTSGFEKIKVFRITYEQIGQDPRVDIIVDDDLGASGDYVVKDAGSSIVNYSYSEFLGLQKVMMIPKEIESKNDYLFASNVAYQIADNQDIITKFSNLDLSC